MKLKQEDAEKIYSDVKVIFESYYKYEFTFTGIAKDGAILRLVAGGCSDDIYRYEVVAGREQAVGEFNDWEYVIIIKDGETIYEQESWLE